MAKENFDIKLAQSEKLIKTYCYSKSSIKGVGGEELRKNLIVTNRRMILESVGERGISRNELSISSIDRIEANWQDSRTRSLAILWVIFGVIVLVISFLVLGSLFQYLGFGLGALLIIVGIIALALRKPQLSFKMSFHSKYPVYEQVAMSSLNVVEKSTRGKMVRKSKTDKKIIKKIIVKITPVALEMINEIGALLLDIKNFNTQTLKLGDLRDKNQITIVDYENMKNELLSKLIIYSK